MTTLPIRIGTRGSQLALWQANHIAAQLRALGHTAELEVIRTTGDRLQDPATAPEGLSPNGTGIFIKEIEDALAANRIDLAVHSLKDLPTEIDPRFTLAAIPPRADARDAFVCEAYWGLHTLPAGSRVATTSPRRQAMVLALRPDLTFVEMRGNIDTRLRKWSEGHADALILASAGLDRLGRTESVHQRFSIDELTPAPGQGALALQVRTPTHNSVILSEGAGLHPAPQPKDLLLVGTHAALKGTGFSPSIDSQVREGAGSPGLQPRVSTEGTARDANLHATLRTLNCATTEFATQAERAVLHALGGGCQLPLGAYAHLVDDHWHLHAMIVSPDGEEVIHVIHKARLGTPAIDFGATVAEDLKSRGALELLSLEKISL